MSTDFNIPKEQQTRFDSKKAFENRQIRIFLSSTFSDMQAERDALVKTFNSLKLEANKRNVSLSIVVWRRLRVVHKSKNAIPRIQGKNH